MTMYQVGPAWHGKYGLQQPSRTKAIVLLHLNLLGSLISPQLIRSKRYQSKLMLQKTLVHHRQESELQTACTHARVMGLVLSPPPDSLPVNMLNMSQKSFNDDIAAIQSFVETSCQLETPSGKLKPAMYQKDIQTT